MTCKKIKHKTKGQAILFQQQIKRQHPFYVYKCSLCGFWHVSLKGLSEQIIEEISELITIGSPLCEKIEKISNRRSMYRVKHEIGTFDVLRIKRKKKPVEIKIIREIY